MSEFLQTVAFQTFADRVHPVKLQRQVPLRSEAEGLHTYWAIQSLEGDVTESNQELWLVPFKNS